jgi:antitoxin (DNA-binding transcriptional repressor) of toxin-antitoxin stability system
MTRIDLDDLPPKLAALLVAAQAGEEILLVRNGLVVGRLVAGGAGSPVPAETEAPLSPEENAKEVFEQFRSIMVDEF